MAGYKITRVVTETAYLDAEDITDAFDGSLYDLGKSRADLTADLVQSFFEGMARPANVREFHDLFLTLCRQDTTNYTVEEA